MDEVYFLVRHTPFWAIPVMLISGEFTYIFWLRKKPKRFTFCAVLAGISLLFIIYYYWAGGPERSVTKLIDLVHYYTR